MLSNVREEDHSIVGCGCTGARRVVLMSTTCLVVDPLAALGALPGVAESVDSVRKAVDRVYGHRVMRRRSNEVTSEAALRGARGSAALSGADWALEEVRRRTDFGAEGEARTVGAALRLTAEAGQLLSIWRQSPLRVLARLHLVAAGGAGARRRRWAGRGWRASRSTSRWSRLPLPDADEVAGRLDGLAELIIAGSSAPALVTAAVVHGELLALRPFGSYNGLVARAAERIVLIGSGLDPKSICPAEVGHAELGRAAYLAALRGLCVRDAGGHGRLDRALRAARSNWASARVDGGVRGAAARSGVKPGKPARRKSP